MKSKLSILIIIITCFFLRNNLGKYDDNPTMVTAFDSLGYYLYLPAIFIYDDIKELKWVEKIDKQYKVTGAGFYQAEKANNGNYVCKYFGGLAIMQLPFFVVANLVAKPLGYSKDGFSKPYQLAVIFAAFFYFLVGLQLLRSTLLIYFSDLIVAIVLISITLATNILQYVSVDCGMTHTFLFFLYCLIIYLSQRLHFKPNKKTIFLLGMACGLAIVTRPTELVCIFIPILWVFKSENETKVKFLKSNPSYILLALAGGLLMILPQLIYWKIVSGDFVYNVGSKWVFLNPNWRVLFGFEKGWFIYTPITILFVLALFFMKGKPFRKSVIVFSLLNIWIIISWFDWRYGGSYSTRALSQSYPVFALGLASLFLFLKEKKLLRYLMVIIIYLIVVNLFQLDQFNKGVLHFDHMNKKYYSQIYLNNNPTPLDFSLLDTQEWINQKEITKVDTIIHSNHLIEFASGEYFEELALNNLEAIRTTIDLNVGANYWNSKLSVELIDRDRIVSAQKFRINTPLSTSYEMNTYQFFTSVNDCNACKLRYRVDSPNSFKATYRNFVVELIN